MLRIIVVMWLCVCVLAQEPPVLVNAERGSLDPAFATVPFDQWVTAAEQSRLRWSIHVASAELSFHQRLLTQVEILVDGREFASRRGKGEFVFFVQIAGEAGARYQYHEAINLEKIEDGIKNSNLQYVQQAFVVPGDYEVTVAIFDSATREHSVKRKKFHITALGNDEFPDSGRDLPPVEMIVPGQSPESWFLPDVKGRVRLVPDKGTPRRIEVIMNVPPLGTGGNLDAMLPTLKVLAQSETDNTKINMKLLDIAKRHIVFAKNDIHALDWPGLKDSLTQANGGTIDVKTLEGRHRDAAFFISEIRKLVDTPPDAEHTQVVIVLSNSTVFEPGENLEPLHMEYPLRCKVVYIRYHALLKSRNITTVFDNRGMRTGRGIAPPVARPQQEAHDQLETTLRSMNPIVFDVETPAGVRRALAAAIL